MNEFPSPIENKEQGYPFIAPLTTNTSLDQICELIGKAQPNWDVLLQHIQNQHSSFESGNLIGRLGGIHLKFLLLEAADGSDNIHLDPIQDFTKHKQYTFLKDQFGNLVANTGTTDVAEYDSLAVINNLPVIFEVKLSKRNRSGKNKNDTVNTSIRPEYVNKKLAPLLGYFPSETFGFVMVSLPDVISPYSTNQSSFTQAGGKLVPLPTRHREFLTHTQQAGAIFTR